jgi:radical SAM PhpK family P-methyltransferase
MKPRLDCIVVGYNDPPMSFHEHRIMTQEETFPERRFFMREHLMIDNVRLACMDVVNRYAGQLQSVGQHPYYHVGEVPNLAAAYLTSYLRRSGFQAEFVSLFRPERARLAELLERHAPRAVAITTTFYLMPWPVYEICQFVAERSPDTKLIVGGPLIENLTTDLAPDALRDVFEWMGGDVYVKESQGEATLARLLGAMRTGAGLGAVPNVYVRMPDGFGFTRTEPERNDLDECAVDWNLFGDDQLGVTVSTRTARSCAFKCSFCDFPIRAGALTLASVETVERELRRLASRGVEHLVFIDDTFNVPISRFKDLCRMMIRNDFGFRWYSFFRCSAARDTEIFDLMERSGCQGVFLGIESGDDTVLRAMVKSSSLHQYRFGMEQLHKRDIVTFASFICGFPGETERSVRNTIDFINETQPTFFRTELWFYNHRSPIHREAAEFGLSGRGYEWEHATMNVRQACDAADAVFQEVAGSIWMPGYNYDFWSIPYLLGKGLTMDDLKRFHTIVARLMPYNAAPPASDQAAAEQARDLAALETLFGSVRLDAPRYRMAEAEAAAL